MDDTDLFADRFASLAGTPAERMLRGLLGCEWGRTVGTPDDSEPCERQARADTVVHDGPTEVVVRLCAAHTARLLSETTPHDA